MCSDGFSLSSGHVPVLLDEVLDYLVVDRCLGGVSRVLDCTLGGGGHSEAILKSSNDIFLVGLDRDPLAVRNTSERLSEFSERILLLEGNFAHVQDIINKNVSVLPEKILSEDGKVRFDSILLDLGVSSMQIDTPGRGFSFQADGPLDMRMNQSSGFSAATIVNEYSYGELKSVFQRAGVSRHRGALTRLIINSRPIDSTSKLRRICEEAIPVFSGRASSSKVRSHPATVPFQALRMAVNDELGSISSFLSSSLDLLAPGGRLAIISFHSLEDKIVTRAMREWQRKSAPRKLPSRELPDASGSLLTPASIVPQETEVRNNPRARSARMRVFERR